MSRKRIVILLTQVIATIGVAVIVGLVLSNFLSHRQISERKRASAAHTTNVIAAMQTISVGVSLPDQWFLYQDSISVKMSQFTGATRTALCFVDASCDACNSEIESVASLEPAVQLRFIFISHDEPEVLSQRQRAAGLQAPLLYDFGGRYFRALNIQTYPFIVVLDSDRRIIQIHAEYVAKEDLKELVGLGE